MFRPQEAVLVDRTTPWGNPFIVGVHGGQGECCDKHAKWLDTGDSQGNNKATEAKRQWVLSHIKLLKAKKLLCWCSPKRCHAEKLAELANKE